MYMACSASPGLGCFVLSRPAVSTPTQLKATPDEAQPTDRGTDRTAPIGQVTTFRCKAANKKGKDKGSEWKQLIDRPFRFGLGGFVLLCFGQSYSFVQLPRVVCVCVCIDLSDVTWFVFKDDSILDLSSPNLSSPSLLVLYVCTSIIYHPTLLWIRVRESIHILRRWGQILRVRMQHTFLDISG